MVVPTNNMGNLRDIVNGNLLGQFTGKRVSITGLVTNVSPDGLSFQIQAVDGASVKILLKKPHVDPLENYVEVLGVSQGHTVACDEIIQHQNYEDDEEFDVTGHNTACILLNSMSQLWQCETKDA